MQKLWEESDRTSAKMRKNLGFISNPSNLGLNEAKQKIHKLRSIHDFLPLFSISLCAAIEEKMF